MDSVVSNSGYAVVGLVSLGGAFFLNPLFLIHLFDSLQQISYILYL